MFGPRGNPQAKNLFAVIGYLQKKAGVHLRVAGVGRNSEAYCAGYRSENGGLRCANPPYGLKVVFPKAQSAFPLAERRITLCSSTYEPSDHL